MKKLWFFVEGDSEVYFVTNLIRNRFYTILVEKDLSKFIQYNYTEDQIRYYCVNCESVDKIPYKLNEWYYMIEQSKSKDIFIVCDLEKLQSNEERKNSIESKLDEIVIKENIHYTIFNPMLEAIYWECPHIMKKVIKKRYLRENINFDPIPEFDIPEIDKNFLDEIKKLFKKYHLKYMKTFFAENFFPDINYNECNNSILQGLISNIELAIK